MASPTTRRKQPDTKHDGASYKVFGAIPDELQTPFVDAVVKAFDKDIRNNAVAWHPVSKDRSGNYQIVEQTQQGINPSIGMLSLFQLFVGPENPGLHALHTFELASKRRFYGRFEF